MTDSVAQGEYGYGWWDTLSLPAQSLIVNSTDDPTREAGTGYLNFPASGTKTIVGGALLPLGWVEGSTVRFDVRWAKTTPTASPQVRTGNVKWSLRYRYGAPGVAMAAYGTAYKTATVSAATPDTNTDDKVLLTHMSTGALTLGTAGTFLQIELSRIPTADSPDIDTYPALARLISIDVHYMRNAPGAFSPYFKYDPNQQGSTQYRV
jgi:hypothetical protein